MIWYDSLFFLLSYNKYFYYEMNNCDMWFGMVKHSDLAIYLSLLALYLGGTPSQWTGTRPPAVYSLRIVYRYFGTKIFIQSQI